jgi:hypothetical protein
MPSSSTSAITSRWSKALPDFIVEELRALRRRGWTWSRIAEAVASAIGIRETFSDLRRLAQTLRKRASRAWLDRHSPRRVVRQRVVEERFYATAAPRARS